jgi:hypothetical protein
VPCDDPQCHLLSLDLVNLLAINEIMTGLWRNQSPGLVPLKGIILVLHICLPMRDGQRILHIIWFTRRCQICIMDRAIGELLQFTNPSLKTSSRGRCRRSLRGCGRWLRCWSRRKSRRRHQGGFDLGADKRLRRGCDRHKGRCRYAQLSSE